MKYMCFVFLLSGLLFGISCEVQTENSEQKGQVDATNVAASGKLITLNVTGMS